MSALTRKQINAMRPPEGKYITDCAVGPDELRALCDMALRTMDNESPEEMAKKQPGEALPSAIRPIPEPTEEMVVAGIKARNRTKGSPVTRYGAMYKAMLAAAPAEAAEPAAEGNDSIIVKRWALEKAMSIHNKNGIYGLAMDHLNEALAAPVSAPPEEAPKIPCLQCKTPLACRDYGKCHDTTPKRAG